VPRLMSWTVACLAAALQISAADAQGNIDAGKTPAQIFGDTCAGCHRSARELRRASASFLRSHYTAGSDEASAMANYLAGVGGGGEPRSSTALNPSPSVRPPMSRSSPRPSDPQSSRPSLGARLRPRPTLPALRSRNLRVDQTPAPKRARCRKRVHFRKSGMSSRHLRHRRRCRCCSRSKSSDRSAAASRARDAASLMTSVQPRPARRLLPLSSLARGELPRPPVRRSARLRPRAPPPRHATPSHSRRARCVRLRRHCVQR
jgi:hypothetical protein